jgi:hypothetical protein
LTCMGAWGWVGQEAADASAANLEAAQRVKRRIEKEAAERARAHTTKLEGMVAAAKGEVRFPYKARRLLSARSSL